MCCRVYHVIRKDCDSSSFTREINERETGAKPSGNSHVKSITPIRSTSPPEMFEICILPRLMKPLLVRTRHDLRKKPAAHIDRHVKRQKVQIPNPQTIYRFHPTTTSTIISSPGIYRVFRF
ncbi:unnamed protein product [Ectocarpus sp. 13 AM-2016]